MLVGVVHCRLQVVRRIQLISILMKCSVQLGKSSDCRHLHTLRVELSVMLLGGSGTGIVEVQQKKFGCLMGRYRSALASERN